MTKLILLLSQILFSIAVVIAVTLYSFANVRRADCCAHVLEALYTFYRSSLSRNVHRYFARIRADGEFAYESPKLAIAVCHVELPIHASQDLLLMPDPLEGFLGLNTFMIQIFTWCFSIRCFYRLLIQPALQREDFNITLLGLLIRFIVR